MFVPFASLVFWNILEGFWVLLFSFIMFFAFWEHVSHFSFLGFEFNFVLDTLVRVFHSCLVCAFTILCFTQGLLGGKDIYGLGLDLGVHTRP